MNKPLTEKDSNIVTAGNDRIFKGLYISFYFRINLLQQWIPRLVRVRIPIITSNRMCFIRAGLSFRLSSVRLIWLYGQRGGQED